jgi:hypothetical protein
MTNWRRLEPKEETVVARPAIVIKWPWHLTRATLIVMMLSLVLATAVSTTSVAGASVTHYPDAQSSHKTSPAVSDTRIHVTLIGFSPTLGATRTQVEALFHYIDKDTTFKVAPKIKGVPRSLGQDRSLYTAVEINGYPEVVDVQVVSILDTANKNILEGQVAFDSLTCREFSTEAAQKWCTGRILNTNARGLVTATQSKTFHGLRITVRTYRSSTGSSAPVVSIDVSAV